METKSLSVSPISLKNALTDVVWVEMDPDMEGTDVVEMEAFCSVESVKSVSEIYAPIAGTITALNMDLEDAPETINQSPYEDGWIARFRPSDMADVEGSLTQPVMLLSSESEFYCGRCPPGLDLHRWFLYRESKRNCRYRCRLGICRCNG